MSKPADMSDADYHLFQAELFADQLTPDNMPLSDPRVIPLTLKVIMHAALSLALRAHDEAES